MVDLVDFITQGDLCDHGHPQIQVLVGEDVDLGLQSFWLHEFGESGFLHNCTVLFAHEVEEDVKPRKSKPSSLFNEVWTRRQQLTQQHGLMGNLSSKLSFTTPSSSSSKHVDRENQSRGIGSKPSSDSRSSGPSCEGGSMALLGKAQCSKGSEQQMGSVNPLRKVRFEDGIHPHEGCTGQHNTLPKPIYGSDGAGRTTSRTTSSSSSRCGIGEDRAGQGDGRRAHEDLLGGVPQEDGLGAAEGGQDEAGDYCGQDCNHEWSRSFRQRRVPSTEDNISSSKVDLNISQLGSSVSAKTRGTNDGLPHPGGKRSSHGIGAVSNDSKFSSGKQTGDDRGGQLGAGLQPAMKKTGLEEPGLQRPLPLRLGKSLLGLMHHVQDDLQAKMADVVYDDKPLVWEMFCSPESNLSNACNAHGLEAVRINLANNFDLYKDKTWDSVYELYEVQKPVAIWVSPKCTFFCDFVDLNYKHRPEVLQKYLRRERQMLKNLTKFLSHVAERGTAIYWEWPLRCRGWKEQVVSRFIDFLTEELQVDLWWCRVDGCRFGLKSENGNHAHP